MLYFPVFTDPPEYARPEKYRHRVILCDYVSIRWFYNGGKEGGRGTEGKRREEEECIVLWVLYESRNVKERERERERKSGISKSAAPPPQLEDYDS